MWHFLRRQGLYFLTGFVIAFIIYVWWRENIDWLLWGVGISSVAGITLSLGLFALERKFGSKGEAQPHPDQLPD